MAEDKRQYERIPTDQSIQLLDGDRTLPALALNISLLGIRLLCDSPTAENISTRLNDGNEELHVKIPCTGGGIDAWCRVIYLQHSSEDECHMGLEYTRFVGDSYEWLEDFIDEGGVAGDVTVNRPHLRH